MMGLISGLPATVRASVAQSAKASHGAKASPGARASHGAKPVEINVGLECIANLGAFNLLFLLYHMARSQFDDVERALELERARELRRAREPKLRTQDGRYVLGQRCRGCGYTKEERDLMEWHSQWREQGPPQCVTCKDGDRLTGRRLTPTHGQPVVCDDEDTCSFFPSLRRFLGMGTRRRRGTKKRGTKSRGH